MRSAFVLRRALACAFAIVLGLLAGCEIFKHNEETTAVVSNRALGMPVGEFFDRYGRPQRRDELADGALEFIWVSAVSSPQGAGTIDDHVCSLRLGADRRSRITTVQVMYDGLGKTQPSRCREIFAAAP